MSVPRAGAPTDAGAPGAGTVGSGGEALVTPASVREAARGLEGVAVRTPLLPSPWLSEETGREVRLKCESVQPMAFWRATWSAQKVASARTSMRRQTGGRISRSSTRRRII